MPDTPIPVQFVSGMFSLALAGARIGVGSAIAGAGCVATTAGATLWWASVPVGVACGIQRLKKNAGLFEQNGMDDPTGIGEVLSLLDSAAEATNIALLPNYPGLKLIVLGTRVAIG